MQLFNKGGPMKISFLGGAGTVTGSKFLLTDGEDQILIDCGMFQGLKQLRLMNWERLNLDAKKLKAVILTHAHLDHCGSLPALVKQGFKGRIYCTKPTQEIATVVLEDSAKIQMEETEYANKRNFSRHHPAKPLYNMDDVAAILPHFSSVQFNEAFKVSNFEITFRRNGHILGSASVLISIGGQRLTFSGDLGRTGDPLMPTPEYPPESNIIVMESTYGDRLHDNTPSAEQLKKLINDCWRRKSILLIPAFALGRSQNLIYEILQLKASSEIPAEIPIYFNSPMGNEICEIYGHYPEYLKVHPKVFAEALLNIRFVKTADESRALNERSGPAVIIAASGMLSGGRVLHHLKAFGGNSNNTILLAGFQAIGTRGWSLLNGKKQLKVHGNYIDINAQIIQSDSFSAHADQKELLQWLSRAPSKPQRVFLVHGEPSAADEMRKQIEEKLNMKVVIPILNSVYDLNEIE